MKFESTFDSIYYEIQNLTHFKILTLLKMYLENV